MSLSSDLVNTVTLMLAAFVLPPLWGWLVYRVMKWCWPRRGDSPARAATGDSQRVDFQI